MLSPFPANLLRAPRRGFAASFALTIRHDASPISAASLRVSGAAGPVYLVGAPITGAAGSAGGLFSVTAAGLISFDRDGLGEGFGEGEAINTILFANVTDGEETIPARIAIRVRRPLDPPSLLMAIPDQETTI